MWLPGIDFKFGLTATRITDTEIPVNDLVIKSTEKMTADSKLQL